MDNQKFQLEMILYLKRLEHPTYVLRFKFESKIIRIEEQRIYRNRL